MPQQDFSWVNLLGRHEQEQLGRRMEIIEQTAAKKLKDLAFESLKKGKCGKCGRWPKDLQATHCPCGGKVDPWKHYKSEAERIDRKRIYDLQSLFQAYQVRIPKELGGDLYVGSKIGYYTTGWVKRKTVDRLTNWYKGWSSRHKKTATAFEYTYRAGYAANEAYRGVRIVQDSMTVASGGAVYSAGGLVAQVLGQWVVAASTGPGGIVIVAYSVFSLVDKLAGGLWYLAEKQQRWDAAGGALTTRLNRVIKHFVNYDVWEAYYKGRVGIDQVAHYETMVIWEYNALRECYVHWDKHRRELLKEANELGMKFGQAVRLAKAAEEFLDAKDPKKNPKGRQDPSIKGADRKAAKKLVKDTRKELEKLYREIEKLIKDLNTRGTKTLNDLNAKLVQLHNHGQQTATKRKRWYVQTSNNPNLQPKTDPQLGDKNWKSTQRGVEILSQDQIEQRLSTPSNERWVGGTVPQGLINRLDGVKTHEFQHGFLEFFRANHRI